MTTYRMGFSQPVIGQFGIEFVVNDAFNRLLGGGDGATAKNRTHQRPPKSFITAAAGDLTFGLPASPPPASPRERYLIRNDGGSWTDSVNPTHMFEAGDSVTISGSSLHDGTYTIDSFEGVNNSQMILTTDLPPPYEFDSVKADITVMVTPALNDGYIVAGTGLELWAGHNDALAKWFHQWIFFDPFDGLRVRLTDTDQKALRHNGLWVFI